MGDHNAIDQPRPRTGLPPLTREEEQALFTRYMSAQKVVAKLGKKKRLGLREQDCLASARCISKTMVDLLITRNMGLIFSVAKKFVAAGEDIDDKVQDGVLKLVSCVAKYDPARGNRFATYLYRALVYLYMQQRSIENSTWRKRLTSIEDGEVEDYLDQQAAPEPAMDHDLVIEFREVLAENKAKLTPMEMKVIRALIGNEPKTFAEIAVAVGLTSGKIKQIKSDALTKLQEVMCD